MDDRNEQRVRKAPVEEQSSEHSKVLHPFDQVWEFTVEKWAKKGIDITNQPMRRDVTGVLRRKRHE
jgi:hypothetical protein